MDRRSFRAVILPTLASTLTLLAGRALGQSFNVDLNTTGGSGAGVPANTFGGAAGQPGFWNSITSATATTSTLKDLSGNDSSVTFTRATNGAYAGTFDSGVSGDTAKLIQDYDALSGFGTLQYSFNNLPFGTYAVYTYAPLPGSNTNQSGVTVTGTTSKYQYVGGDLVSNKLTPGVTHAIHIVTVGAGGSITVKVSDSFSGTAHVGGFQLRKIDSTPIRFYVNDTSAQDLDGTSWGTAYHDLQIPLIAADNIGGSNVEIWTAQGTYRPTTGTSRTATFKIPTGIRLYGGFAGIETSLTQRTFPWVNITILSGAIGGSSQTDNSYHVVDADGVLSNTVIDGFSIARGYASGSGDDARAGGMTAKNSSIICENMKFLSNYSSGDGGAVLSTGGNPQFIKCLFYDNWTNGSGGGVYHHTAGTVTFGNTQFLGNRATGDGGAVKTLFANMVADGCVFNANAASFGDGGAVNASDDTGTGLNARMCTFANNIANLGTAGGAYITGGADATVTNSILWGNTDGAPNTTAESQIKANTGLGSFLAEVNNTIQGMDADPLFVDIDGANNTPGDFDDNLRLTEFSPCIDAGSNNLVTTDAFDLDGDFNVFEKWAADLDGQPRFVDVPWAVDTGSGSAPLIDRGAFEYQYTPCPADFDGDGFLTGDDFDAFVAAFEAGETEADFNNDGFVSGDDFDAYVSAFEAGC